MNFRHVTLVTLALVASANAAPEQRLPAGAVTVKFNSATGTFSIVGKHKEQVLVRDAHAEIGQWSFMDPAGKRTVAFGTGQGELGPSHTMTVSCVLPNGPTLVEEFAIYGKTNSFVVVRAGLTNTTGAPIRIKQFKPITGGVVYPGAPWNDIRTLNGDSSCAQARVTSEPFRSSANDLLLTFRQNNQRHSVVLGALKTAEFTKWARTMSQNGCGTRGVALEKPFPGARLVSYFDCGAQEKTPGAKGPEIAVARGTPFTFDQSEVEAPLGTILFDDKELAFEISKLDPKKRYALGISWWDYDANGRVETVSVQGGGKTTVLTSNKALPAFKSRREVPVEFAMPLESSVLSEGRCRVLIRSEKEKINAVVSEIWLWELEAGAPVPESWMAGHNVNKSTQTQTAVATVAELEGSDPVGKLVEPGEVFWPEDTFYLDCGTADPFVALERYGRILAAATHADPHIYDFPTICAWYAGVWKTQGAQDYPEKSSWKINTTPGLVEEMEKVRDRGFLNYSRMAVRLVPDTYQTSNPQGWWDDAHWQKEGYYVAPYDTSQKYGKAVHDRGGLAFTYFQPTSWSKSPISLDFRESHTNWLCGKDVNRTLDYTLPAVREHLRYVTDGMRGGIDGMMVDYCDELWEKEASHGGFSDPKATSTAFYRTFFRCLKTGLGTNSWLHERNLNKPNNDLTLGIVDSQRTSGDTDKISPDMVSRSGLRWYKNRVVLSYDMDSKELVSSWKIDGFNGSDKDGRRMMLTMAYVAASRLLLANSLRDLPAETIYDLERIVPFYSERRSARPIDAFVSDTWPRVYDYQVTPKWHQVTLYNNALPTKEARFSIPLNAANVDGGLGLSTSKEFYVFDFWNNCLAGKIKGSERLEQVLRPGEARMLSVHEVEANPQFLSCNRHLMQGYLDLARYPVWDRSAKTLSGASKVVGGEPYEMVLAANGYRLVRASASNAKVSIQPMQGTPGLALVRIESSQNATIEWSIACELEH